MSHKYPLESDYFRISHGSNYLNFFKKLGKYDYYYMLDSNNNVCGTACGVLRNIQGTKTWYICDLKVDPKARGNKFSFKCLVKALIPSYLKANKCYAICMQPNNPVDKLISKLYYPKIKPTEKINIYLLNYLDILHNSKEISDYYGTTFDLESNIGIKDIILESTGLPLKVLHIKKSDVLTKPILSPEYKYFISVLANDKLNLKLKDNLFGSALIYSYNMENFDWKLISSADI